MSAPSAGGNTAASRSKSKGGSRRGQRRGGRQARRKKKAVIRKIPHNITEEEFEKTLEPYRSQITWWYFRQGFVSAQTELGGGITRNGVAYAQFQYVDDLQTFAFQYPAQTVFIDVDEEKVQPEVEFAPYQRIPRKRPVDKTINTIDDDPDYQEFMKFLEEGPTKLPTAEQALEAKEAAGDTPRKRIPIIEFMKNVRLRSKRSRKNKAIMKTDEKKKRQRAEKAKSNRSRRRNKARKAQGDDSHGDSAPPRGKRGKGRGRKNRSKRGGQRADHSGSSQESKAVSALVSGAIRIMQRPDHQGGGGNDPEFGGGGGSDAGNTKSKRRKRKKKDRPRGGGGGGGGGGGQENGGKKKGRSKGGRRGPRRSQLVWHVKKKPGGGDSGGGGGSGNSGAS